MPYFNYYLQAYEAEAASGWQRREFIHAWWRIYARDQQWTPPDYRMLGWSLNLAHNPHLARMWPTLLYVDALQRTGVGAGTGATGGGQIMPLPTLFESTLAAAVLLRDPRRTEGRGPNKTAYLALFQAANDSEGVERLLDYTRDLLGREGYSRLLLPTGLSPHLGSGMLQDSWDLWPSLHTPSNPPYVPDLLNGWLPVARTTRLYQAAVPPTLPATPPGPARLVMLDPQRLAADLLPLLVAATEETADLFPPPDAEEARFLLRWLDSQTLIGRVAEVDGVPVGFVLLQPDFAGRMRRARGGRLLFWRAWLATMRGRPVRQGRLLFGGVLPEWRGQGVGKQLWGEVLSVAHEQGWATVTVGPLEEGTTAAEFIGRRGATAQQGFSLYGVTP